MLSTGAWIAIGGAVLLLLGILLRRRTSRYDLKDAAIDTAWTLVRGKRTADNPTALEAKFRDIQSQATWRGRGVKAAGAVAGHFAAQVSAVVSLVMILAGLALIVGGYLWK